MEAKKATEAEIDVEVLDLPGVPEDANTAHAYDHNRDKKLRRKGQ